MRPTIISVVIPLLVSAALTPAAAQPVAPISLTASDGTGLRLVALDVRGVLEAPLAFTELRMSFENPEDRVIEGRFRITLPPAAAISRFAMKVGGHWQEGEVVERQRARQVYEDFLHRRQDPALLEQEAGNEFSARVFPIPARGLKELILSYSHALPRSADPYVVPLRGLPEIATLDVRLLLGEKPLEADAASNLGGSASDRRVIRLHKEDWTPTQDFEVAQDYAGERAGLRSDNLVVVRVAPAVESAPQEISGLYVLFDSSASRALGFASQLALLERLLGELSAATPVGVAAFDQEVTPIYDGPAGGFGERPLRRLRDHQALGASDLHRALRWLAGQLGEGGRQGLTLRSTRVLVITDGIVTAGQSEGKALREAVRALGDAGVRRLDVLAVGGLRDHAVLRQLVSGNLASDGQVIDGAAPLDEISRRLTRASRSGIEVSVRGAAWVWPQVLDGVQPGDEVLVYADLPASQPLGLALDGRPVDLGGRELERVKRPLLERAWVQARIDRLLHLRETRFAGDPDVRRALQLEVTQLSVENRVLSPYTAFLVLETEWDYARYQLDRRALADILTVGPAGLEVVHRTPPPPPPREKRAAIREEELLDVTARADSGAEAVPAFEPLEFEAEFGEPETSAPATTTAYAPSPSVAAPPPPAEIGAEVQEVYEEIVVGADRARPPSDEIDEEEEEEEEEGEWEEGKPSDPYSGRFAEVMRHLADDRVGKALDLAESWRSEAPGDVLALVALGEACEARGDRRRAARAYGSLIDLFPARADLRRYAGERLERLAEDAGVGLAADSYEKAVAQRPDHPSGHRLLAWALYKTGRTEAAFEVLERALRERYPEGRFRGVRQILQEDLGLMAAVWLRAEPALRTDVLRRLRAAGARLEQKPSLRFVLTWETDANDVDLHVYDGRGAHAYYDRRSLPSGGELYADVTTGYGPECLTIRRPFAQRAYPYRLRAHYYRRGPMGYGMGTIQILDHDGRGKLRIEDRPFVVMIDGAYVELGTVKKSTLGPFEED